MNTSLIISRISTEQHWFYLRPVDSVAREWNAMRARLQTFIFCFRSLEESVRRSGKQFYREPICVLFPIESLCHAVTERDFTTRLLLQVSFR